MLNNGAAHLFSVLGGDLEVDARRDPLAGVACIIRNGWQEREAEAEAVEGRYDRCILFQNVPPPASSDIRIRRRVSGDELPRRQDGDRDLQVKGTYGEVCSK